jgi:stearoyl-CoA desaturase (delta-9 desaturase)
VTLSDPRDALAVADGGALPPPKRPPGGVRLSPGATLGYALLHLGCFGVLYTGISGEALAVLVGAFVLRALGVSLVYHRYLAHRSYHASRPVQFLLAAYGTLTVLGGPLWWAETHRAHHRHADTPDDIHSPSYQGFLYSHCGWFLDRRYREVDLANLPDLARFPELVWLERHSALFKLLYIAGAYAAFGVVGIVWGFFLPSVLVLQMIHWIQSVSHSLGGYRRYPTPDDSRNHWLFGVLSLGEGFHHNHHCFPGSARIGLRWWEFDLGYAVLAALARLGVIGELHLPAAAGQPPVVERRVARACAALQRLAGRVSDGDGDGDGGGDRGVRRQLAERIDALGRGLRTLLVQGPFVLRHALADLKAALLADAPAAGMADAAAVAAAIDAAIAESGLLGREGRGANAH